MPAHPPRPPLVRALRSITEDGIFATAASGSSDDDTLQALAKRRDARYESLGRGGAAVGPESLAEWLPELCAAIAPVCPPDWMPMADVVRAGVSLEGGARGVRSLFTSKPSEKEA